MGKTYLLEVWNLSKTVITTLTISLKVEVKLPTTYLNLEIEMALGNATSVGKKGILKKYCFEFKKKIQDKTQSVGDAAVASKSYEPSEVLAVSTKDMSSEWILDSTAHSTCVLEKNCSLSSKNSTVAVC